MFRMASYLFAVALAASGCSSDEGTEESTPDQQPAGKSDSAANTSNQLELSGDRFQTVHLDDAVKCEAHPYGFHGTWVNPADPGDEIPAFHVELIFEGGELPKAWGPNFETSVEGNAVYFDGIGYHSDEGDGCTIDISDIFNEGPDGAFGIAMDFGNLDCRLRSPNGAVWLEGTVACIGQGFDVARSVEAADAGSPDQDVYTESDAGFIGD